MHMSRLYNYTKRFHVFLNMFKGLMLIRIVWKYKNSKILIGETFCMFPPSELHSNLNRRGLSASVNGRNIMLALLMSVRNIMGALVSGVGRIVEGNSLRCENVISPTWMSRLILHSINAWFSKYFQNRSKSFFYENSSPSIYVYIFIARLETQKRKNCEKVFIF